MHSKWHASSTQETKCLVVSGAPGGNTPQHTYMHVFRWWPQAGWVTATWSSAFPILKTNTIISTATCTHEEVLMASREKKRHALYLCESSGFCSPNPFLQLPNAELDCMRCIAGLLRASLVFVILTSLHKTRARSAGRQSLAKAAWLLACQIPGTKHSERLVLYSWFGKQLTEQKKSPGLIWHRMNTWALR